MEIASPSNLHSVDVEAVKNFSQSKEFEEKMHCQ